MNTQTFDSYWNSLATDGTETVASLEHCYYAAQQSWQARDAEVAELQAKIESMKKFLSHPSERDALWKATYKAEQLEKSWECASMACNKVADERDALQAKLTEAERKLAVALEAMKETQLFLGSEGRPVLHRAIKEIEGSKK